MNSASKIAIAVSILTVSTDGFVTPQPSRNSRPFVVGHDAFGRIVAGTDDPTFPAKTRKSSALHMSSMGADEFLTMSDTEREDEPSSATAPATTTFASTPPSTSSLEDTTTAESESSALSSSSSSSPSFTPFQHAVRALPLVTTAAYLYDPRPLDGLVATAYSALYNWDVAQVPIFEAEVAAFSFVAWIVFFSSMHLFLGEERTKETRFDGELPHKPFEWAAPENFRLWFNPLASYLGSIWLYLQIHEKPPLPELPPTFGVLAVETLFGIFLYDLCFMPVHYLMHNLNIGSVRKVHGYHHRSGTTLNGLETVQHSYIDGFFQVFVNIMVQHISPFGGPKHVLSRLLHNISVTYLLTESHSGYRDLPWMSHNLFPEILGGAPRHEAHHHNGRVYYQQYFKYIDDFFGFTEDGGKGKGKNELETIRKGIEVRKREREETQQAQLQMKMKTKMQLPFSGSDQPEELTLLAASSKANSGMGVSIAANTTLTL